MKRTPTDPKPIAEEIRAFRLRRGLSQNALAKKVGVKQQTIADWENGKAERKLRPAKKLFALMAA